MASKNISITLDENLLNEIDKIASSMNIKRSPAIVSCIAYLAQTPENLKAIMPKGRDYEEYWKNKKVEKPRIEIISAIEETNVLVT